MDENKTILIDIEVNADDANRVINTAQEALRGLKAQQIALDKAYKEGNLTRAEYANAIGKIRTEQTQWQQELKSGQAALRQAVKEQTSAEGSLEQLRAQLAQATKAYDNLSRAEREGAKGKEMLAHIQNLHTELMDAEAASGRFQRNVGNYPKVFDLSSSSLGKFSEMLGGLAPKGATLGQVLGNVGGMLKQVGAQALKLMANPFVITIAAIVAAVKALVDAFKKNDDAMTALQSAFAAFKPIGDLFKSILDGIVKTITKVIEGIGKLVRSVMSLIPAFREYAEAEEDIVRSTDRLQDAERDYTVAHAKRNAEITRLAEERANAEGKSARERLALLQQESDLREKDMQEAKAIAAERLRLARERAALDKDTSDETKDNLAQLEAAVVQAEADYNAGMRRLAAQRTALIKENKAQLKERINAEREAVRAMEDARVAALREAAERERAETEARTARELAEIRERIKREKSITIEERAELYAEEARLMRRAEEEAQQIRAAGMDAELAANEVATRRAVEDIARRLSTETNLTAAARKALADQQAEIARQGEERAAAIREEYARRQVDAEAELARKIAEGQRGLEAETLEAIRLRWENRIAAERQGSMDYYREVLEVRTEQMNALQQAEGESTEAFYARQLAAQAAYNDAVKQLNEAELAAMETKATATTSVLNSAQSLFKAFGDENREAAMAAKALALGQVAVETGVAVAKGVAQAQSVPFPANIAAIATTVATVLANMATAISTVRGAAFAKGGLVRGAGTETSDSITARLSNGEAVMTARAVKMFRPLLSAMNVAGGGVSFDQPRGALAYASGGVVTAGKGADIQAMQAAMRDAVAGVQPVVSVKEITRVTNRVKVKELNAKS